MDPVDHKDRSFQGALRAIRHDLRGLIGLIIGFEGFLREAAEDGGRAEAQGDLRRIREAADRLLEIVMNRLGGGAHTGPDDEDWEAVGRRLRAEVAVIDDHRRAVARVLDAPVDGAEPGDSDDLTESREDLDKIATACQGVLDRYDAWMAQVRAAEWRPTGPRASSESPRPEVSLSGHAEAAPPAGSAERATAHGQRVGVLGEGGRLLLVDDDPATLEILTRLVRSWGYVPLRAGSGDEALDILAREQDVDLVLMDMVMPGLSGGATLRRLKADPALRGVPVIMLTGIDDQTDVVRCILDGAEDYILKPPNPVLLRARISASLEKKRLRQKLATVLKVFVSSPGDVEEERALTKTVIDKLNVLFQGQLFLYDYNWEQEPLFAHDTFQSQIMSPAEADIYVGIFWSRLGSPLPARITRPDGSRYLSGSEYEFEQAVQAFQDTGRPQMLIYRKMAVPVAPLTDRRAVLEALDQHERLESFLHKWFKSDDGQGFERAFHPFADGQRFAALLLEHLKRLAYDRLEKDHVEERVSEFDRRSGGVLGS
ncbi:response regulator [Roseospira visakhapatnamensis]|uniref:CheY-like chemotaxis protein n=1 Tax=Roseospira visakhapatnamensis TaxID=390880 RepID=A0A7W6WAP3_9PROT|nr:response regulator [Roseospira visakhapatnamensis]MBB4267395.1 CheY-like chemotaxis protein [Roseospira visakhapatnamensis]